MHILLFEDLNPLNLSYEHENVFLNVFVINHY